MNWKTLVEAQNAKSYVLPAGWDSREKIAEQLECSTDRVRVFLAPAIKSGVIETGVYPVWDNVTKRVIRVTAYRRKPILTSKTKGV
jgi:hypothetical protein